MLQLYKTMKQQNIRASHTDSMNGRLFPTVTLQQQQRQTPRKQRPLNVKTKKQTYKKKKKIYIFRQNQKLGTGECLTPRVVQRQPQCDVTCVGFREDSHTVVIRMEELDCGSLHPCPCFFFISYLL